MLCLVVGMLALYIVYGAPRTQPTEALAALSGFVTRALGAPAAPPGGDETVGLAAEEAQEEGTVEAMGGREAAEAAEAAGSIPNEQTILARKAKEKKFKKAKQED